MVSHPRSQ